MSQIFPFMAALTFGLPEFSALPVEMWALILRYLDPISLLTAIRTSQNWMRVARGDPVLRTRVRQQLQTERRQLEQFYLNPAMASTVIRNEAPAIFGKNVSKIVIHNPFPRRPTFQMQPPTIQPFSLQEDYCQRRNSGPMRKRKFRTQPYKTMRC